MITDKQKRELTTKATNLSKWFKIELTISIFNTVILHWVYPPQKDE